MYLLSVAVLAYALTASAHPLLAPEQAQAPAHHQAIFAGYASRIGAILTHIKPRIWSEGRNGPNLQDLTAHPPITARHGLKERYDNDLVLRFNISSQREATAMADAVDTLFLDVWEFTPTWADVRLSKDMVQPLLGLLPKSMQHAHKPLMHDLAQAVREFFPLHNERVLSLPEPSIESRRPFSPMLRKTPEETNIFFRDYQPLSVIVPWMHLMRSMFTTHVRIVKVGESSEGRDILGLRLGVHPQNSEKPSGPRKTIVISGGSHAREWISVSSTCFAAYSMIVTYGKDKQSTKLIEEFDWIFVPTLNPDGYVYTWDSDRLWRKNTQATSLRFCRGLDIDRAFGFEWDGDRTKGNPCSESFAGEAPFQAVEALRFANWVKNETANNNVEFVAYLDLHSYSQQILYPYSFSCINTPPTLENLEEVGLGLSKAVHQVSGEFYGVASACEGNVVEDAETRVRRLSWPRIESSGGSALDWMYHEIGVKYAYQIKLRDTGGYGFLLPKENIVPSGREVAGALKFLGSYLLSNKGVEDIDQETVLF